jgi:hypothetical protein
MSHHHGAESDPKYGDASLACATQVTPTFAPDGTLWLVWAANRVVSVAHSSDLGRTFSTPVAVNSEPLDPDWGPDSRPNIVVDKGGRVFVAFARFKDQKFNGEVSIHARPTAAEASPDLLRSPPTPRKPALPGAGAGRRRLVVGGLARQAQPGAGRRSRRQICRRRPRRRLVARSRRELFGDAHRARQHLRMLPACRGLRGCRPPGAGVPQHFRRHGARPRGDHVHRCAYSRAGQAGQRRRLEDRGLSAPGAGARHRRRRQLSRCLVHQRHGAQGLVLCAVERRRRDLLAAAADRRSGAQSQPSILARRRADAVARLEGIRRRAHQCADNDIA